MELRSLHWAAQGASISDEEMGDALTDALDGFAGDANVRVVVVTGGAPDY
jgi:enoyl-CoA hydratase/carnithine racemase